MVDSDEDERIPGATPPDLARPMLSTPRPRPKPSRSRTILMALSVTLLLAMVGLLLGWFVRYVVL